MSDVFVCVASGPSLTRADCWLAEASGHRIIAVNDSWKLIRCDILYAGDMAWWHKHHDDPCDAERWTCSRTAAQRYGLHLHVAGGPYNSGQRAIQLAVQLGAKKVVLLGYDCSLAHGVHWHGLHDGLKNPDAEKVGRWQRQFDAIDARGADIVNCSRHTELKRFRRSSLEAELGAAREAVF